MKKNLIFFFLILIAHCPIYGQWVHIPISDNNLLHHLQYGACDSALFLFPLSGGACYRTFDNGDSWQVINFGKSISVVTVTQANKNILVCTHNQFPNDTDVADLFRSLDNGRTWEKISHDIVQGIYLKFGICLVASDTNKLAVSTDNGNNWEDLISNFSGSIIPLISDNKYLYATTTTAIFRSADTGKNWINFGGVQNSFPQALETGGNVLYHLDTYSLYKSTDSAEHWTDINPNGRPSYGGYSLLSVSKDYVFVVDENKNVLGSIDSGKHWYKFGSFNGNIYSMFAYNNYLFVATDSILWRRPFSEFSGVKNKEPFFPIVLNPNPTTGKITFYNLPENLISIQIVNVLGQNVAEFKPSANIDLTRFLSGIYYLKIISSNSVIIQKIIKE